MNELDIRNIRLADFGHNLNKTRQTLRRGVHGSAERPLSRWFARDTYNPRRHSRMSTAKPGTPDALAPHNKQ
jgi:hypothetical protein